MGQGIDHHGDFGGVDDRGVEVRGIEEQQRAALLADRLEPLGQLAVAQSRNLLLVSEVAGLDELFGLLGGRESQGRAKLRRCVDREPIRCGLPAARLDNEKSRDGFPHNAPPKNAGQRIRSVRCGSPARDTT